MRPSRISRSVREAFPEVREWSGVPPGVPVVVRSGRQALMEVRVWLGGPPRGPGVVGRPSRRSGSGREALTEV